MDFPIDHLMDESACYQTLLHWLHPSGLSCPQCGAMDHLTVHRRHREPVLDYRCHGCRRVFNAFTNTIFSGTHRRPSQLLLILRGMTQGVPTAQLAREQHASRVHLLELRHQVQANAQAGLDLSSLADAAAEADEMYQNAGEKRRAARRSTRSAAATGQLHQRPRHLGERSAAGAGRARSAQPAAAAGRHPTQWPIGVAAAG